MYNGINSTFDSRKRTVHRLAERVLINRNYDDEILEYDIALVKIKQCDEGKCYKFSTHIRPIALPQSELCQKQKKKRKSKKSKKNRKNKRQKERRNSWLVGRKALITG